MLIFVKVEAAELPIQTQGQTTEADSPQGALLANLNPLLTTQTKADPPNNPELLKTTTKLLDQMDAIIAGIRPLQSLLEDPEGSLGPSLFRELSYLATELLRGDLGWKAPEKIWLNK